MPKHPLYPDALLGSREIRFLDRQSTNYPNLTRLCLDFDFRVIQILHDSPTPTESKSFVVVAHDYRTTTPIAAITPACTSLEQLEEYITKHLVDILHDYLFDFVDDDMVSGQIN